MGKGDEHTVAWCQKEKPGVLAHSTPIYNIPERRAREGPQETSSKPCCVLLATTRPSSGGTNPHLGLFPLARSY